MNDTFTDVPWRQITWPRAGLPLVIALVVSVAVAVWLFGDVTSSHRDPLAAKKYAEMITRLLSDDSRFQKVQAEVCPIYRGGEDVMISGLVNSEEDSKILVVLIASTRPPVRMRFSIFLPDFDQKLQKPLSMPEF